MSKKRPASKKPRSIVTSKKAGKKSGQKPPSITEATIQRVYVAAGGRCSFPDCNVYLLDEPLTRKKARLGNIAHIVAESPDGPRGDDPLPMELRSEFENLMLLCPLHHDFVDKKELEKEWPVWLLHKFKKAHEDHVRAMTGTKLSESTTAIRMIGQIRGHLVSVSDVEIRGAVFDHERKHVESIVDIDIGTIPDGADLAYLEVARNKVAAELRRRVLPLIENGSIRRLSIFALSRIPVLCELGYGIGDKVPTVLYQRHRVPHEGWPWPAGGDRVSFDVIEHEEVDGGDDARIAVLIAISGSGDLAKVRRASKAKHVYEIVPIGELANRTLVASPATLDEFRNTYQRLLSRIEKAHPGALGIDMFLAAPAPVAIICGRDIPRDVLPDVVVHDLVDGQYIAASVLRTKTALSVAVVERPMIVAATA